MPRFFGGAFTSAVARQRDVSRAPSYLTLHSIPAVVVREPTGPSRARPGCRPDAYPALLPRPTQTGMLHIHPHGFRRLPGDGRLSTRGSRGLGLDGQRQHAGRNWHVGVRESGPANTDVPIASRVLKIGRAHV